jgi:hypothetical protein
METATGLSRAPGSGIRDPIALVAVLALTAVACDAPRRVSQGGHGAYEASLIPFGDGFAVAWYDDRDGNAEIYFRLLDSAGAPAAPEQRITNDPEQSYEADVQALGDRLVIAWYDKAADESLRARLGVWTREGGRVWSTTITGGGVNGRNPIVRVVGSSLFAAWIEDTASGAPHVWAGWWDAEGHVTTPPRLLADAGQTTWNLNGAIDGDGVPWVVFDATAATRADELFAARVDRRGGPSGPPSVIRLTADDGKA